MRVSLESVAPRPGPSGGPLGAVLTFPTAGTRGQARHESSPVFWGGNCLNPRPFLVPYHSPLFSFNILVIFFFLK